MKLVRVEENRNLIQRTSFSYQKLPYRVLQALRDTVARNVNVIILAHIM